MNTMKTLGSLLYQQKSATVSLLALVAVLLSACTVGPDYVRPEIHSAAQFKENKGWLQVTHHAPQSAGDWWTVFGDNTLNELEPQVAKANQSLRASYYAYQQALALTSSAKAGEWPTIGASVSSTRSKSPATGKITEDSLSLNASWAPDFWGKIRQQVSANEANAQASEESMLAAQLSLQASLAQNYFQIRQLDGQIALQRNTVVAYEKSLQLTQNRYAAGIVAKSDVVQAELQLANARVSSTRLSVQRSQLEHAIAVLIGKTPSEFSLPEAPGLPEPQVISVGLPSQLLLRRPDLLAAERQVAAANAQIGVAESAYFPSLTISASDGWRSNTFSNLVSAPNSFWSIGPALAATLFDSGARSAQVEKSKGAYQQVVAQYRQLSLQAFQQVEDQLAAMRILAKTAELQQQAVSAADDALRMVINAYKAGTVSYLNVLNAQTATYTAHDSALQIAGQRLTANIALIQALGGKWGDDASAAKNTTMVKSPQN
jgi:NodT family efflux transporter outer membrane factor (OMF) lipoprotein